MRLCCSQLLQGRAAAALAAAQAAGPGAPGHAVVLTWPAHCRSPSRRAPTPPRSAPSCPTSYPAARLAPPRRLCGLRWGGTRLSWPIPLTSTRLRTHPSWPGVCGLLAAVWLPCGGTQGAGGRGACLRPTGTARPLLTGTTTRRSRRSSRRRSRMARVRRGEGGSAGGIEGEEGAGGGWSAGPTGAAAAMQRTVPRSGSLRCPARAHTCSRPAKWCPACAGKLPPRLHAHADMDVLTILFNRVGAFQPQWLEPLLSCTALHCSHRGPFLSEIFWPLAPAALPRGCLGAAAGRPPALQGSAASSATCCGGTGCRPTAAVTHCRCPPLPLAPPGARRRGAGDCTGQGQREPGRNHRGRGQHLVGGQLALQMA